MMKFLWLVLLACIACRLVAKRWPWELISGSNAQHSRAAAARRLLGVDAGASRQDIVDAHRRLVAAVHPDRGGTAARVHEANDARDFLLNTLDKRSEKP